MADPSTNSPLPGTRSTEAVADVSQLDFLRNLWPVRTAPPRPAQGHDDALAVDELTLAGGPLEVRYVRHPRARRYRLLFRRDGTARCTVPRRGTLAEARRFVASQESWLTERRRVHQAQPAVSAELRPGGTVWIHGREEVLQVTSSPEGTHQGELAGWTFPLRQVDGDLRPAVEAALRQHASEFLRARIQELAVVHGFQDRLRAVSVRNQRTRWGSCSPRGLICLNWRLLQTPQFVQDYVILHELAHLRQLNHSPRFWAEVARICPNYQDAEAWLKRSGRSVL